MKASAARAAQSPSVPSLADTLSPPRAARAKVLRIALGAALAVAIACAPPAPGDTAATIAPTSAPAPARRLGGSLRAGSVLPRAARMTLTPLPAGAARVAAGRVTAARRAATATALPGAAAGGADPIASTAAALAAPGVPACTQQDVSNINGGGVIQNPRVRLLFWGSWNATEANQYAANWQTLANSAAFYTRVSEYSILRGSYLGRLNYPQGAAGAQSDCSLQAGLASAIRLAHITPDPNDIYIIMMPPTAWSQLDCDANFQGHHAGFNNFYGSACYGPSTDPLQLCPPNGPGCTTNVAAGTCTTTTGTTFNLKINGTFQNIIYGVIDYAPDINYTDAVIGHEILEAATDPVGDTFMNSGFAELGDICEGPEPPCSIHGLPVQRIWSQSACRCVCERDPMAVDFLGNGLSTPTVFRPSSRTWFPLGRSSSVFAGAFDVPFGGDLDGDGVSEMAAFHDAATGSITSQSPLTTVNIGTSGDKPVPADYDGDGIVDRAVWHPATGVWTVKLSASGTTYAPQWGVSTDIPVPGDYDGDGVTEVAVFRPSEATWYILFADGSWTTDFWTSYAAGDILTPGDYNGDGLTDFAFWDPPSGTWFVWYNNTSFAYTQQWGQSGDVPVPRDYDGDWLTDLAVWRPSSGTWFFIYSSNGATNSFAWGQAGDIPVQRARLR
jgi:hypothetical protein